MFTWHCVCEGSASCWWFVYTQYRMKKKTASKRKRIYFDKHNEYILSIWGALAHLDGKMVSEVRRREKKMFEILFRLEIVCSEFSIDYYFRFCSEFFFKCFCLRFEFVLCGILPCSKCGLSLPHRTSSFMQRSLLAYWLQVL